MCQADADVAKQEGEAGLHIEHERVAIDPVAATKRVAIGENVLQVRLPVDADKKYEPKSSRAVNVSEPGMAGRARGGPKSLRRSLPIRRMPPIAA